MSGDEFLRLVSTGDVLAVHRALQEDPRLAWAADAYGQTGLMYAIDQAPHLVPALLQAGADPNHITQASWTPLAYAIKAGKPELVSALLWAGADPWRYRPATEAIWGLLAQYPNEQISRLLETHAVEPREPQPGRMGWTYVSQLAEQRCTAGTHAAQDVDLLTPLHPEMVFTYVSGELPDHLAGMAGVERVASSFGVSDPELDTTQHVNAASWQEGYAVYTAVAFKGSNVYCLYVHPEPQVHHSLLPN